MIIAFVGMDGAGKTTAVKYLIKKLDKPKSFHLLQGQSVIKIVFRRILRIKGIE